LGSSRRRPVKPRAMTLMWCPPRSSVQLRPPVAGDAAARARHWLLPGAGLRRWGVAAADVAALGAAAQVQPPAPRCLALDAAGTAWRDRGVDAGDLVGHEFSEFSGWIGRRTWNRVSPGTDSTRRSPWCFLTTIRHAISSPSPVPSPTG